MLKIVQPFFASINAAASIGELLDVLNTLAGTFGFRSGFLIEFPDDAVYPPLVLDTHPDRHLWWDYHCDRMLDGMSDDIKHRLMTEPLFVLNQDRVVDRPSQVATLRERLDLNELTLVPIKLGDTVVGCVGFSGSVELSPTKATALQTISVMLFAQCRIVRRDSVH